MRIGNAEVDVALGVDDRAGKFVVPRDGGVAERPFGVPVGGADLVEMILAGPEPGADVEVPVGRQRGTDLDRRVERFRPENGAALVDRDQPAGVRHGVDGVVANGRVPLVLPLRAVADDPLPPDRRLREAGRSGRRHPRVLRVHLEGRPRRIGQLSGSRSGSHHHQRRQERDGNPEPSHTRSSFIVRSVFRVVPRRGRSRDEAPRRRRFRARDYQRATSRQECNGSICAISSTPNVRIFEIVNGGGICRGGLLKTGTRRRRPSTCPGRAPRRPPSRANPAPPSLEGEHG